MGVLNRVNQVLMKADVMVLAATSCIDFGCMVLRKKNGHKREFLSLVSVPPAQNHVSKRSPTRPTTNYFLYRCRLQLAGKPIHNSEEVSIAFAG